MFPPAFAPRMGYLAKYLRRMGWGVSVVTEQIDEDLFSFLTGNADVRYIDYYKAKGKTARRMEWIGVLLMDYFFGYKDRKMAGAAERMIKQEKPDVLLCSSYRTFPLPAARRLARKYKLPLVVDLRDIVEQYPSNEFISKPFNTFPWLDRRIVSLFRRKLLRGRNPALREAGCVTTISPWHVEVLKQYNPQTELIYNGYDPELFYHEADTPTPQFRITYCGRLVSLATRDPEPLFEAIAMLAEEGLVSEATFRVWWHIDEASRDVLWPLIDTYGIARFMDYRGYVKAEQIPRIMNQSSILLQLANKASATGPKGIMTTKLFESFAVEKPILCVRSDESYLEEMIRKTHTGIAARDAREAYGFILRHYREWEKNGYTTVNPDREAINSFSRMKQAEQFVRIFEKLT